MTSEYRDETHFIETMAGCCVVRVVGHVDDDDWRWVDIDLLSNHGTWRLNWRDRIRHAWSTLRTGQSVDREWISFVKPEEADYFIAALISARHIAFPSGSTVPTRASPRSGANNNASPSRTSAETSSVEPPSPT